MDDRERAAVWVAVALLLVGALSGERQIQNFHAEAVRLSTDVIPDTLKFNTGSARLTISIDL